jgi:protein-S-isoprenylcysteine O-methyltransferase Ste14
MPYFVSAMAFTVFAAFAAAVRWHFRPGTIAPGMLAISVVGVLALAAVQVELWRLPPGPAAAVWSISLMAAALALFTWAIAATRRARLALAFSAEAPTALLRHGPYRWVRHPFYASYVLFWLGCVVAAPSPPVLVVVAAMILLYVVACRREEARFLASPLAAEYRAYRRQAGALLPRPAALWGRRP